MPSRRIDAHFSSATSYLRNILHLGTEYSAWLQHQLTYQLSNQILKKLQFRQTGGINLALRYKELPQWSLDWRSIIPLTDFLIKLIIP